ncbi:J domain-containing protein [Pacificoceanicola onchidii]|uniref:J domain-containing protein n=1 Tax=Pacificoceanicola onchidii TaxID=2562685 RepID=UPI0010A2ABEE|nr:DnaJ domain-containing protein [Pacificoceanicola onchidii]
MPRSTSTDDPYALLGVKPTDDFETIRAEWRRLVKTYHPDVWYGSERAATRRLMAINDAFDEISVMHKRAREEAERATKAPRSEPQTKRAKRPQPKPRAASKPRPTPPMRAQRPSPYAERFDQARAAFTEKDKAKVQAFA